MKILSVILGKAMHCRICFSPVSHAIVLSIPSPRSAVRDRAVFSQVKVPLVVFSIQVLLFDFFDEPVVIIFSDGTADDFTEAGWCEQVEIQDDLIVLPVGFHVERLCLGGVVGDEYGPVVHL